jgi:hypothetical protein
VVAESAIEPENRIPAEKPHSGTLQEFRLPNADYATVGIVLSRDFVCPIALRLVPARLLSNPFLLA